VKYDDFAFRVDEGGARTFYIRQKFRKGFAV